MLTKTPIIAGTVLVVITAGIAAGQTNPLSMVATAGAGTTQAVALAALSTPGLFVTSLENGSSDLEVIAWRSNSNQSISRLGSLTFGKVGGSPNGQLIAAAGIANNRFVTAVINGGNVLELIVCVLNANGTITRLGSTSGALPITALAITALDSQRVVTVTTNAFYSTVTTWIVASNGNITSQAVPWIINVPSASVAVTALSTSQILVGQNNGMDPNSGQTNSLTLCSFSIDSTGAILEQVALYNAQPGENDPAPVSMVALGGGNVVVASFLAAIPFPTLWNVTTSGVISFLAEGTEQPSAGNQLAAANVGGLAFTIDNGTFSMDSSYAINIWAPAPLLNYQIIASAQQSGCSTNCIHNVAAASLPEGGVVVATSGGATPNLNLAIWQYTP